VALTYIIEPQALGEQKSKAAQLGIKRLMEVGVQPHMIACRARNEVTEKVLREDRDVQQRADAAGVLHARPREHLHHPRVDARIGLGPRNPDLLGLHSGCDPMQEDKARRSGPGSSTCSPANAQYKINASASPASTPRCATRTRRSTRRSNTAARTCRPTSTSDWIDTTDMDQLDAAAVAAELEGPRRR
jgi:hypothetical protein